MRNTFINELYKCALKDERIWLICGDLGYSVLDTFMRDLPDRCINAGVAEQNMTGMSAGIALAGKIVFTYSIANFPTFRCLEQIRNDICYHNLNVKIISVGAGLSYGTHGYTHNGVEDLAIMRCLPNIQVICPVDPREAVWAVHQALLSAGPMYIRLGKNGEPDLHLEPVDFGRDGGGIELFKGCDITVISTGSVGYHAYHAVKEIRAEGIDAGFVSMPVVQPIDASLLSRISGTTKTLLTVEEHRPRGGFSSAVAEAISDLGLKIPLSRLTLPDQLTHIGSQSYLLKKYSLDKVGIKNQILAAVKRF